MHTQVHTHVHIGTALLAWSVPEAARYLETLRAYARKPADLIKERSDGMHACTHDAYTRKPADLIK